MPDLGNAYAPYAGHWDAAPQTAGDDMEGTTETATPVSTAETTTTAAPAITETTSATTTSQRPTNVQELASWMENAATTTTDPAATQETAATGQAAPTDPTSATKAAPPAEKWPQILENARTKATQEAKAAFERDHGWAMQPGVREQIGEFSQIASQMTSDPIAFLNRFVAELQANPVHAAQLRSNAGRMLAARDANTEPQPDVQIVDANGQVTGMTYSDKQFAKREAWNKAQLMAEVQKEFGPLKAERDQRQAQQKADQIVADETRQLNAIVDSHMSDINDHLGIDASMSPAEQKAIYDQVTKLMDADPSLSGAKAAARVARTLAESRVVGTFNKKAAGNTARAGQPATPTRPRNAQELASWMEANFR